MPTEPGAGRLNLTILWRIDRAKAGLRHTSAKTPFDAIIWINSAQYIGFFRVQIRRSCGGNLRIAASLGIELDAILGQFHVQMERLGQASR